MPRWYESDVQSQVAIQATNNSQSTSHYRALFTVKKEFDFGGGTYEEMISQCSGSAKRPRLVYTAIIGNFYRALFIE